MTIQNIHRHSFLQLCDLGTLINTPTCYQSQNPTCIDHFLTNCKTFGTGLDHLNLNIFDNHISIKKIREYFQDINYGDFDFKEVSLEDVKK